VKGQTLYIRSGRRPFRRSLVSRLGTLALLALALLINYLVFFRSDPGNPPVDPIPVIQPSTLPQKTPALPASDPAGGDEAPAGEEPSVPTQVFAGELRSGDRVLDALERIGLDRREARKAVTAMEGVFDFRNAKPGDRFHVQVDPAGRVDRFEYTRSPVEIYEVTRSADAYRAARREVRTAVEIAAIGCVVRGSWRESLLACTHDADLANAVNDLLASTVDLASEVRGGDEVRLLAERVLAEGEFLRYGDVVAIDYHGKLASTRFYRFGEGEDVAWYQADGTSIERRFLRSPLKLAGEDAYAGPRVHPGLHRFKNHSGLDYPVDKGAPVVAVGGGKVGFAGPKGTSGTLVSVRHGDDATTYYAHLSRLAPGLRKGSKVQQGELIGWSGDSGSTTGAKLHFAMKVDGKFVNPLTRAAEPLDTLDGAAREAFDALVKQLDETLRSATLFDPQTDA